MDDAPQEYVRGPPVARKGGASPSRRRPRHRERITIAPFMPRLRAVAPVAVVALLALTGCPRPRSATPTPASALVAAGISASLPAQLDSIMSAAIADRASPGITIAIGHHGR